MAELVTNTSGNPPPWIFLRRTEAPIADEPIPASQAKTMLLIGPVAAPPARAAATLDFLPFIASISAVAAARSASTSSERSVLSSNDATRNDTVAAPITDRITPR